MISGKESRRLAHSLPKGNCFVHDADFVNFIIDYYVIVQPPNLRTAIMIYKKRFDAPMVLLTFGLAFLGIYLAVGIAEQLRLSFIDDRIVHGLNIRISRRKIHMLYLMFCAISVGVISIWGMHYVSLYSMTLLDEAGNPVPVRSNSDIQILSLFVIFFINLISITTASYDDMFSKTKVAIINEFIAQSKSMTMKEIRSITLWKLLTIMATQRLDRILIGGTISSLGVLAKFYISLRGLEFPGEIHYHAGWTVFAVTVIVMASLSAYWIFFRLLSIFPELEWLRFVVALLGSIATSLGDYLVLASAEFRSGPLRKIPGVSSHSWSNSTAFSVAFSITNVLLWLTAIAMMMISRYMIHQQSRLFHHTENIVFRMADDYAIPVMLPGRQQYHTASTTKFLVEQYVRKRCDTDSLSGHRSSSLREHTTALLERQQMSNMSFHAYILLLVYYCVTLQWEKLWRAVHSEFCLDMSSSSDSGSRHGNSEHTVTQSLYPAGEPTIPVQSQEQKMGLDLEQSDSMLYASSEGQSEQLKNVVRYKDGMGRGMSYRDMDAAVGGGTDGAAVQPWSSSKYAKVVPVDTMDVTRSLKRSHDSDQSADEIPSIPL